MEVVHFRKVQRIVHRGVPSVESKADKSDNKKRLFKILQNFSKFRF